MVISIMTTQIKNLENLLNREINLIGNTYYVDLSIGGSYLLPLFKMNETSGMLYTQTWDKLKQEQKDYIYTILENYGREAVSKRKNRIIDGYSEGCETVTIIPASTKYIVWMMDLVKDMNDILSSYSKYIEFEY